MALPKEPRQKMINIMYLVLTAILALNVSAEVIEAFRTVKTSLESSSSNIKSSNDVLYKSLSDKLKEPESAKQAAEWQPLAEKAKQYSADLDTYIEGLKTELKKYSGARMVEKDGKQVEEFKLDDLQASTRLMEKEKKGDELKAKLEEYKAKMLAIHPEIKAAFESTFPVNTEPVKSQEGGTKEFTVGYFHMTPAIAALTMLSKFQNNVKNAENQIVTFCHSKIGAVEVHMDQVGILVGQSSNYLMPGQELVVKAGVGAYSSASKGSLTINGVTSQLVNGQTEYKTTVSGGGAHTIQITGTFTGEDGKPVPINQKVEYVVGTPGGAAVMLDKMNVFYIGVDNPITISSGTGWDKTTVSMAGGTISGSNSNRTVRVTGGTAASITVSADGKSNKFDFRIKRIPDPVFKVGDGKIRMPSVSFKAQDFCRAELENFDFDTKYTVTSATVYFSGANFANVQTAAINSNSLAPVKALMARCGPGSVISFDNVKVTGPDGSRTIDGKSIALY
ncbi:type IX secretion system motor protein PorM/GldM [Ferruginibacter sp.]|nr:gliding motility protein GldM [Ferruginibacter sp.]